MSHGFPPDEKFTLPELQQWAQDNEWCPCCERRFRPYRRSVSKEMAGALVYFYRRTVRNSDDWVSVRDLPRPNRTHETAQLRWWNLIEEQRIVRPDGGHAGMWRLTRDGVAFVEGNLTIHKYAMVFRKGEVQYLRGPQVTLSDCLKEPFDLRDI